jgi:hypothetical protein
MRTSSVFEGECLTKANGHAAEVDGMLAMVGWLGAAVERFVRESSG